MSVIERLNKLIIQHSPVCVGLDTLVEHLPESYKMRYDSIEDAIVAFNCEIIEATMDLAACFKVQIAGYEAVGLAGMRAYVRTFEHLRQKKQIIIADVKRSDIASTAKQYAKAHFSGDFAADFITINPFLGFDTVKEFLPWLENGEHGIFVLVKTSNPGWQDIEGQRLSDGRLLNEHIALELTKLNESLPNVAGFGPVGAVLGCTNINDAERWSELMPRSLFLIPGYGAQGGSADVAKALVGKRGQGVVNSSRAILTAWQKSEKPDDVGAAARAEVERMAQELRDGR